MALPIRQNATHKVVIGPVVAVANGYVPVTTLSVATADEAEAILHDNGTVVDISGYTFAAITTADGYYHLTLQSGISGAVGHMSVVINDDSLCLPVRADFIVIEEAVYDAIYAASALGYASQSSVDAIDNFIDTEIADIQSRLPAALVGGRIDASIGAAAANTLTASALATDAVTEIQSGLATAADLATVAGYLDTEIAAILADTNELQTDWANGGRLDLILDARASQTSVDTIDDFLDTEIASLTTELAKVPKSDGTATWNATALASIQAEATDALNAYDPPTRAELTTDINSVLAVVDDLGVKKNTAFSNFEFLMVLTSDHVTPATGLTVTGQRSIDGAAFASVSGTIAEVSNGIYQFDAAAADTNGDVITWRFSSATADDAFVTFKTVA